MKTSRCWVAFAFASLVLSLVAPAAAQAAAPTEVVAVPAPAGSAPAVSAPAVSAPAGSAPSSGADYDYEADTEPSAVTEFRDALAPHGRWIDDPTYGTVWIPSEVVVGKDFAPYRTAGRWGVAEDGQWLWISDYDWGYIPFHYGRWVWLPASGWAWIPGRVYAPAWVMWRTGMVGYDYLGWAPMPPSYIWMNGLAVGFTWGLSIPWWFCPTGYFFSPSWGTYIVRQPVVIQNIYVNSTVYGHGHAQGYAGGGGHVHAKGTGASSDGPKSAAARMSVGGGMPRSPSFAEARMPKRAVPKERVAMDPSAAKHQLPANWRETRATAASQRSATAASMPSTVRPSGPTAMAAAVPARAATIVEASRPVQARPSAPPPAPPVVARTPSPSVSTSVVVAARAPVGRVSRPSTYSIPSRSYAAPGAYSRPPSSSYGRSTGSVGGTGYARQPAVPSASPRADGAPSVVSATRSGGSSSSTGGAYRAPSSSSASRSSSSGWSSSGSGRSSGSSSSRSSSSGWSSSGSGRSSGWSSSGSGRSSGSSSSGWSSSGSGRSFGGGRR
ncbi:MAG: hypothetical protein FJ096_11465 [Deltaproteobacteria bacterium]|nr:hypothetical protein [Deltaproteobacteria bacterium]